jgi:hypothetical protein
MPCIERLTGWLTYFHVNQACALEEMGLRAKNNAMRLELHLPAAYDQIGVVSRDEAPTKY